MEIPLGPHLLLFQDTLGFSSPIIWRYPRILKSYYIRVPIGQQRDVTMLILPIPIPNAIGSIGIGSLQGKIKLGSFEKLMIVSDSSTPPNFDQTL
jgi:hypothetical protein